VERVPPPISAPLPPPVAPWHAQVWSRGTLVLLGVAAWWTVYRHLEPLARWLTYDLLAMAVGSRLALAVEFFVFEAPKVLMLLVLVVFGVGIVRSFFTPERTRRILAGQRESVGSASSPPGSRSG
jgi:uncharacterized protein